jgi:hypothetical protein
MLLTEGSHYGSQLFGCDRSVSVLVKHLEAFLELFNLAEIGYMITHTLVC